MSEQPAKFSAASLALIISAVVFSGLIYYFVNENIFKPGFQPLPSEDKAEQAAPVKTAPAQPAPAAEPARPVNTSQFKPLDLSLDKVIEFEEPPMLQDAPAEEPDELEKILTKEKHDRLHLSGEVFMDEDVKPGHAGIHDIDGGKVELQIDTVY